MKKTNKPLFFLILFFLFSILFSANIYGQWPGVAPVNPPTGGFNIEGTLKANTSVGDWCAGTGAGGFVLAQTAGVWGPVNSTTTIFQRDAFNSTGDLVFTGSAFSDDPNTWKWASSKPTSKCDIATTMFHVTASADSKWIILGGDRYTTTGTSYIDVEFDQGILTRRTDSAKFRYVNADGTPIVGTGGRIPGDFVLSMEYSNGGATANVHYYVWENSGGTWKYVEHPIPTISAPLTPTGAVSAYGRTNADSADVPYVAFGRSKYEPFAFVEAAVNIDAILGGSCSGTGLNIRTVMVKTKASDSYNAALKDFVEPQPVSFTFGSESMNYGDGTFCKSEGTATPNKSGTGTFTGVAYGTVQAPGLVFSDGTPSTTGVVNLAASGTGSYIITYTFSAGGGCSGEQKDTITINDVTAGSISGDQTICSGGDPAVFGSVAATGGATPTYQWQSSTGTCGAGTFSNIVGATSATYDVLSGLTTTTTYRRVATSTVNGESCTATSNCVTVTVNAVTAGTVAGDQTICSGGDPAAFTVAVAATGSQGPTYQWQKSTTSCASGFSDIGSATSATYDDPGPVTQTTYYRRIATSTVNGTACSATSNCITVTVNDVTAGTIASDQPICSGGNPAAFTVSVAATGSATPTYQWQKSTTSCASGFSDIASATSAIYDEPGPLTQTTYYRRIATSTLNGVACSATSNCVTVTVNNNPSDLTADVLQPTCTTPTGTITVTSGTSGLTFSLNSSNPADFTNNTGAFNGLAPGNYTVRSKNGSGCISNGLLKVVDAAASTPPAGDVVIVTPVSCASSTGTLRVVVAGTLADYNNSDFEIAVTGTNTWYGPTNHEFPFTAGQGYHFTIRRKSDHTCTTTVDCAGEVVPPQATNTNNTSGETGRISTTSINMESTTIVKAFPNPFNDRVKFVITSPESGYGSLDVMNMLGQKVKTVFQGQMNAGTQTFEMSLPQSRFSTLFYIFRMNGKQLTGKLVQTN